MTNSQPNIAVMTASDRTIVTSKGLSKQEQAWEGAAFQGLFLDRAKDRRNIRLNEDIAADGFQRPGHTL